MHVKIVSTIIVFLLCQKVDAFNLEKCRDHADLIVWGIMGFSSVSSEFASSTGNCSALGLESKKDKVMLFVILNSESIQNDLARKNGEALSTLEHLAELSKEQLNDLARSSEARVDLLSKDYDQFYELLLKL